MKNYYLREKNKLFDQLKLVITTDYADFIDEVYVKGFSKYLNEKPNTYWAPYLDIVASKGYSVFPVIVNGYLKTIMPNSSINNSSSNFSIPIRVDNNSYNDLNDLMQKYNPSFSIEDYIKSIKEKDNITALTTYNINNYHCRSILQISRSATQSNVIKQNQIIYDTFSAVFAILKLQLKAEWATLRRNAAETLTPEQIAEFSNNPDERAEKKKLYDEQLEKFDQYTKDVMKQLLIYQSLMSGGGYANKKTLKALKKSMDNARYYAGKLTRINY